MVQGFYLGRIKFLHVERPYISCICLTAKFKIFNLYDFEKIKIRQIVFMTARLLPTISTECEQSKEKNNLFWP